MNLTADELRYAIANAKTLGAVTKDHMRVVNYYREVTREAMFACEALLPLRLGNVLCVDTFREAIAPLLLKVLDDVYPITPK